MRLAIRSRRLSLGAGVLLSLVLAGQSLAATWSFPVVLASSVGTFLDGLVTLDNGTAVVAYVDCGDPVSCYSVVARRSTDSGATWDQPTVLSTDGYFSAISGRGSKVDITWAEDGRLMYARSRDSAVTFGRAKTLAVIRGGETSVARGPDGLVAVTWTNSFRTGVVKARVSVDGGYSFGPRSVVAVAADDAGNPVAVGDGVVYVAFMYDGSLWVRSSLDFGATWSPPALITDHMSNYWWHQFSIAAEGYDAYVIYPDRNGSIRIRRTTDRGASWFPEVRLTQHDRHGGSPNVAIQDGVVRAVFNATNGLYYRESIDGVTWTPPERISEIGYDARVGLAGKVVVAYNVWVGWDAHEIRARSRTP